MISSPSPVHQQPTSRPVSHPIWLLTGFWICVIISIAVVVRRLIELTRPLAAGTSAMEVINDTFSSHATLTAAHIIPAAIFVLLAVVLLLSRSGRKRLEPSFYLLGLITGITAYAMSVYAIGGWIERSAVLVFNSWFLFSLARSYLFRLQGDVASQRNWMTRAVGILLGIATTRPVMGVFFATSSLTHLSPQQFFGIAFWIGFSINAIVIELWLHSKTRSLMIQRKAA